MAAADPAHRAADAEIAAFQRDAAELYREAEKTARERIEAYLERFEKADADMRDRLNRGEITKREYSAWRQREMLTGKRYRSLMAQMAAGYTSANESAMGKVSERLPGVYADNYNYGTYQAETGAGVDTAFALKDASTVDVLLKEHGSYLPKPSVNRKADLAWNRRKVSGQIAQGVLLGESIPKIARRVRNVTGSNLAAAVRTARTSVTAAENCGRVDSYKRAESLGIEMQQEWMATLDVRTRKSHRDLDGERVEVGGTFSNGCRYPGDPQAPYAETMNCRCTLVAAVAGIDQSDAPRWSRLPEGMTYEEWKASKPAVNGPAPANRTIAEFMDMPGTARKLDAAGVSKTEARHLLTAQLRDYGIPSGSFRKMGAGDQQKALDASLARKTLRENPRDAIKPVNEKLYASQRNYAERHGCTVIRGGEYAARRLGKGEDAAYSIGGRYILLQDPPTTSEVLEEVFHFKQDMRGDYAEIGGEEMIVRREIDAQNYLLSVSKRYNIPSSEVEQTRKNLSDYEDRLREIEEANRRENH